ncbi:TetR/AcrR family transcriptional regulator [Arthrobacter sp. AZCC_0090]|uniref:TetR/AcrR family transcriptional regulator n=1 Tax=Arthrobacter sp. AZCC_0090 TaxID=2735881 RepID=UPI00160C7F61|nr:TetR/AcrR family transcriptional regulator [Arthrobacter sp. AZCC_0090]MBB6405122.1 AcrR family transcriptional regulator [Arthrobacter sp. AZCC_0090]
MQIHVPDLATLTPRAQRILDVASTLFYERGIHAVGVDTIAEAAGVTKRTLYDRFGSKESLVVAYLRQREEKWRKVLNEHLDKAPQPGVDRVLSVFDAAALWYRVHGSKGCSAINARAETAPEADGHFVFPEVSGQKAWMLNLFTDLCAQCGCPDPTATGRTMMLLFEGALVTLGMRTFAWPVEEARTAARAILIASIQQNNEGLRS